MAAALQPALRRKVGLGPDSRVVVVICEGASDPDAYAQLVTGDDAGGGPEKSGGASCCCAADSDASKVKL